jgi:hypothetical protein
MQIHPGNVGPVSNAGLTNQHAARILDETKYSLLLGGRNFGDTIPTILDKVNRDLLDCFSPVNTPFIFPPSNLQVLP